MRTKTILQILGFGILCYSIAVFFMHSEYYDEQSHQILLDKKANPGKEEPWKSIPVHMEEVYNGTEYFKVCFDDDCLDRIASKLARPFSAISTKNHWCIPTSERGTNSKRMATIEPNKTFTEWQGVILVKVPKAASSTCAGVVLRLANHSKCAVQWEHREGRHYQNRTQHRHLLIGSIRRPAQRAYSNVWYFQLGPLNITPTDENVIRALNTKRGGKTMGQGGYQFNYLSLTWVPRRSVYNPEKGVYIMNPHNLYKRLYDLIQGYHFLMVVERMDESVTALALLLGIPLSHVLVLGSKVSQSAFNLVRVGPKQGQCIRPRKLPMSPGVKSYFDSEPWMAMNYADDVLYRMANISLDQTIHQIIGKNRFQKALDEYRRLKEFVSRKCGPLTGCNSKGQPVLSQLCYERDFGCGYPCINEAMKDYYNGIEEPLF